MKILHGILSGFAGLALLWAIFAAGSLGFLSAAIFIGYCVALVRGLATAEQSL